MGIGLYAPQAWARPWWPMDQARWWGPNPLVKGKAPTATRYRREVGPPPPGTPVGG